MGKVDVMKILLDHHANPEAKARFGWTPIFCAVMSDTKDAVQVLLEKRPSTLTEDQDGWPPLHVAACNAKVKVMWVILDADPAALERRTQDRRTPLYFAFHKEVSALWLLEREATIKMFKDEVQSIWPLGVVVWKCFALSRRLAPL